MLSLNSPGSFRLCANPAFEEEAVRELESLVSFTGGATHGLPVSGLLLTGSFARGEGVIVPDRQAGLRWLSDVECLVVMPDDRRRHFPRLAESLGNAAAQINREAGRQSKGIKIELSPILASRLAAMRPAIFSCELIAHAKLLWGRPDEIPMPPEFEARSELLRRDAFRLLNNRIMEQIALRLRLADERVSVQRSDVAYALSKFWVELGTSVSVFLDCYCTSYQGRQAALEHVLTSFGGGLDEETVAVLVSKLAEGMALKLGHISADQYCIEDSLERAADIGSRIWWWETSKLLGKNTYDPDWRSVAATLRRVETAAARIRDWGRLLLRSGAFENLRAGAFGDVLRAGSFGNAVYAAGCLLTFFWDQVGSGDGPGLEISRSLGRLFGVDARCGRKSRRLLAECAVHSWSRHLRSAAA